MFRTKVIGVTAVATCALLVAACSGSTDANTKLVTKPSAAQAAVAVKDGGTATVASFGQPGSFNPYTSKANTATWDLATQVFPGAFVVLPNGKVEINSGVLSSAKETATDPQVVTYTIAPSAAWSNGDSVTAEDFVYVWQHLNGSNRAYDVSSTTGYQNIKSVVGSNGGKTVTVTFATPYPFWQSLFAWILPSKYLASLGDDATVWNGTNPNFMNTSAGPFKLANFAEGSSATLTANASYAGPKAHLAQLVVKYLSSSVGAVPAIADNEIQAFSVPFDMDQAQQLQQTPGVNVSVYSPLEYTTLGMNGKNSWLGDPAVRKAIAQAVSQQAVVNQMLGSFASQVKLPESNLYAPDSARYQATRPPGIGEGDASAAKATLRADGFTMGADGYFTKDGKVLSLRLSTAAGNPSVENMKILLQAQLKDAGISIELKSYDERTYFTQVLATGNFDLELFGFPAGPFPLTTLASLYTCNGGYNFAKYCDPHVDALFSAILSAATPPTPSQERQLDDQLWKDGYFVPLAPYVFVMASSNKIGNVEPNPSALTELWNAQEWGYKSQSK